MKNDELNIFAINPGSTSTKVAFFTSDKEIVSETIAHSASEIAKFEKVADQADFRAKCVEDFAERHGIDIKNLDAVVGRGGLLKPISGGVYRVNAAMLRDLSSGIYGEHPCNLGGIIAEKVARDACCAAFIVDPVVVDEMDDIARFSGMPEITRISIFHALNQKSVSREIANKIGKPYCECNFIVAHIGGGISVGAHRKGRVIDVNNAFNGDGPFSPERSGGVPAIGLAEMCFSGKYTLAQVKKKIAGLGGMVAYKGTNDFKELSKMIDSGDEKASLVREAMAYQISKEIAMHGATLEGDVDRIIITGGIANDADFVEMIARRVRFLATVEVIPGEREMLSLARGFIAVKNGSEKEKEYVN